MARSYKQFNLTVTAPSSSSPSWYTALASGTWGKIAATKTVDAAAQPLTSFSPWVNSTTGIIAAWCGAQLSQARGEYMLVANGGHNDYAGNEAYALNLRQSSPEWVRLNAPTPAAQIGDMFSFPRGYGDLADGRSRAMHTQGTGNYDDTTDRAWFVHQGAVTGIGSDVPWVVSFNRGLYGAGLNGYTPAAYPGPGNPWQFHTTNGSTNQKFIVSAFDPIRRVIWATSDSQQYPPFWWVNVDTFAKGYYGSAVLAEFVGDYSDYMVACPEIGLMILGLRNDPNQLWIKDLTAAASTPFVKIQVPSDGFNWNLNGTNNENGRCANYYHPHRALYIMAPHYIGRTVRKLTIPTNPLSQGSWSAANWSTTYLDPTATTFTLAGNGRRTYTSSGFSSWNQGTFNRVRLLNSVDNQTQTPVLVYVGAVDEATHVFKIPVP